MSMRIKIIHQATALNTIRRLFVELLKSSITNFGEYIWQDRNFKNGG